MVNKGLLMLVLASSLFIFCILGNVIAAPISPPYNLDIDIQAKLWDIDKPIPIKLRCVVQGGKTAKINVAIQPWRKMALESDAKDIVIGLPVNQVISGSAIIPATLLIAGSGEFMLHFSLLDANGKEQSSQTLFIISRNKSVSISGSDFRICEWQFIMAEYGLPLDTKLNALQGRLKEEIESKYRLIRRDRRIKEEGR
jgi:hypothetical protein